MSEIKIKSTSLLIAIFFNICAFSQTDLVKQVQVVRPFEPKISDAFKLNILPDISDTIAINPEFEYKVNPTPLTIDFDIEPIKAAKLIGEPLKRLYGGSIKLGFGNYLTPLINIGYSSKYSKKYSYNANFKHFSSSGKIRNNDSRKMFAGFSENNIQITGKKFMKEKALSADINYQNNSNFYYGYNTDIDYLILPARLKKEMNRQRINSVNSRLKLQSNYLDSTRVNYDMSLDYGFMQDINKTDEHNLNLNIDLNYFFENEFTGINTQIININRDFSNSVLYANPRVNTLVSNLNTLVVFNPWMGAFGSKWEIVAGVNTFYELENTSYHFYPHVNLHYNVIDYFLVPYFELGGRIELNSFKKLLEENPYFLFPVNVKPTEYNKVITGGFRGFISSEISFDFNVNYNRIKNMYFFVNDTNYLLENTFSVVYDDLNLYQFNGEIQYHQSEKLSFLLQANYFIYQLDSIAKPWHKPDYTINFNTHYSLADKIILDIDVFAIGKRDVQLFNPTNEINSLKPVFDFNLGVQYRYTPLLTAFLQFNNMAAMKYYKWNYYPSQRFHFMAGISYSF